MYLHFSTQDFLLLDSQCFAIFNLFFSLYFALPLQRHFFLVQIDFSCHFFSSSNFSSAPLVARTTPLVFICTNHALLSLSNKQTPTLLSIFYLWTTPQLFVNNFLSLSELWLRPSLLFLSQIVIALPSSPL